MIIKEIKGKCFYCIVDSNNAIIGEIVKLDENCTAITAVFEENGQKLITDSSEEYLLEKIKTLK